MTKKNGGKRDVLQEAVFPYVGKDLSLSTHWADRAAEAVIRSRQASSGEQMSKEEPLYVLASGITPSGTVHIGNFRELIVVDLVARALKERGKKIRFIFSWDNFDPLRKIPKNFPEKTTSGLPFSSYLTYPLTEVPDPKGEYASYAERNQSLFEQTLERVGIYPEFIYQAKQYTSAVYVEAIKESLNKRGLIRQLLNESRREPLGEEWYPITLYCEECKKSQTRILSYDGAYTLKYECTQCAMERSLNFKEVPLVKLLWRVDWPMRWRHEGVVFEPGGKDHSSDGGSFDTAKKIAREVFATEPPFYLQYDFVLVKGDKSKMASSEGNVLVLDELLSVYEPEIVRFLYTMQRPNVDFAIALDLDVIKNYEAFDRLEQEYFGKMGALPPKKAMSVKRLYELSLLEDQSALLKEAGGEPPRDIPFRASFRHLTSIIQVYGFKEADVLSYYKDKLRNALDEKRLRHRIQCAIHWLHHYAPEEFCFTVRPEPLGADAFMEIEPCLLRALQEFKGHLNDHKLWELSEKALFEELYALISRHQLNNQVFFKQMYHILIDKEQGPRLASFLLVLGAKRIAFLFSELVEPPSS